jgi:hypothetical protein
MGLQTPPLPSLNFLFSFFGITDALYPVRSTGTTASDFNGAQIMHAKLNEMAPFTLCACKIGAVTCHKTASTGSRKELPAGTPYFVLHTVLFISSQQS